MSITERNINELKEKYKAICFCLNEKGRRRLGAAIEARSYGRGGVTLVCKATELSTATLYQGFRDLDNKNLDTSRVRSVGGGGIDRKTMWFVMCT